MTSALLALWLCVTPKSSTFAVTDPGSVIDLSGLWLFQSGDNPIFAQPTHDDSRWDQRRVPTAELPSTFRWSGYGWYRVHLEVDTAAVSADLMLSLGPA